MKWYLFNDDTNQWFNGQDWKNDFMSAEEYDSEDEAYDLAEKQMKKLDTTEIYVLAYNYCR